MITVSDLQDIQVLVSLAASAGGEKSPIVTDARDYTAITHTIWKDEKGGFHIIKRFIPDNPPYNEMIEEMRKSEIAP